MKYWLRYIWHRVCNDFCQLTGCRFKEEHIVGEVMGKLKLEPLLRELIEEQERKEKEQSDG